MFWYSKDIIEIDSQIAKEIKQGIIAAPEGRGSDITGDTDSPDDNVDINIGDE